MKSPLFIFTLITAIFFIGCKKDKSQSPSGHFVSAYTSSGESFYTSGLSVGATGGDGTLSIKGTADGTVPEVAFSLSTYTGVGTYSLDGVTSQGMYINLYSFTNQAISGTLSITSAVPDIIGTYSFSCTGGLIISGSFNTNFVPY